MLSRGIRGRLIHNLRLRLNGDCFNVMDVYGCISSFNFGYVKVYVGRVALIHRQTQMGEGRNVIM